MQRRGLAFFEWVVIDNCNLDCSYCVNKGEYSQKNPSRMRYTPGIEVKIAQKIREVSSEFDKVVVNLTGGEPTIASNIVEAVKELAGADNIEIRLITNLKAASRFEQIALYLSHILVSLHLAYRNEAEVDCIISTVNSFKDKVPITLSQVDLDLTPVIHARLARIQKETGLPISYQTFIPPWTEEGKIERGDEKTAASFQLSRGKRCSLGYFYFFIEADATLRYDLWCSSETSKEKSFLSPEPSGLSSCILSDMKKCPKQACGCNYNYFYHDLYLAECKRLGYSEREIFLGKNIRPLSRLGRLISKIKTYFRGI